MCGVGDLYNNVLLLVLLLLWCWNQGHRFYSDPGYNTRTCQCYTKFQTVLRTNISIVLVSSLITKLMFTASNSAHFCTHLTANMLHYPKGRCHTAVDDGGAWGQSIKSILQVFWIFVMQHHPCQPDHPLQHVIVDKGSTVKKPAADAEILKKQ